MKKPKYMKFGESKEPSTNREKMIIEKLTQDLSDLKVANPKNVAKGIVGAANGNIESLVRVMLFLDTSTPVGQFAHFWQGKVITGVYTPDRIVEMDVSEMLPEVFLSKTVSDAQKATLLADIQKEIANQTANIDKLLDPFGRRNQKMGMNIVVPKVVPVREMCENITDVDEVNMIICKQDGKFYCLDIDVLLFLLAQNQPVVNYLTNKPLPAEIAGNLKRRYGSAVIGNETFVQVYNFYTNVQKTSEDDLLFAPIEDLAGPQLIKQGFDFIAACEKCDKDTMIANIKGALLTIKNGGTLAKSKVPAEPVRALAAAEPPGAVKVPPEAVKVLPAAEPELLKPGTFTFDIYNRYLSRAENIVATLLAKIKESKISSDKEYYNDLLKRANEELSKIKNAAKDKKKLKNMLTSERAVIKAKLNVLDNAGGIYTIFDEQQQIAEQNKQNWQLMIELIDAEMSLL